jgi:hypothetical protein
MVAMPQIYGRALRLDEKPHPAAETKGVVRAVALASGSGLGDDFSSPTEVPTKVPDIPPERRKEGVDEVVPTEGLVIFLRLKPHPPSAIFSDQFAKSVTKGIQ